MIDRKNSSLFIGVERRLKESIALVVQNMVHVNTVIEFAFNRIYNSNCARKLRITLLSAWILFSNKIIQLNLKWQLINL